MILNGVVQVFVVGFIGALSGDFLTIWSVRQTGRDGRPAWLTSPFYWIVTLLMALLAGAIAVAYGYSHTGAIETLQIGASTPVLLKSFTTGAAPPSDPKIG